MKTLSALIVLATLLAVGILLINSNATPATSQHFMGLGDLPGGDTDSAACGVSADGTAVVGYSNSARGMEAFRWTTGGGIVGLGFPRAYATSADGSIVVGYRNIGKQAEPVRWTKVGGTIGLGKLADDTYGEATGISADGSVIVGGYCSAFSGSSNCTFLWSRSGGIQRVPRLPDGDVRGAAPTVSADGAVVVGAIRNESGYDEAIRFRADTGLVRLGFLPGDTDSFAHGVSADGSVVVGGSCSYNNQAFRWTEETGMVGLGTLPDGSRNSLALGVSADGSVIVGQCYGQDGFEAFIWDATGGMRSVRQVLVSQFGLSANLRDWKLLAATAVSADGSVVVGYGINRHGNREAWFACLGNEARPLSILAAARALAVARLDH